MKLKKILQILLTLIFFYSCSEKQNIPPNLLHGIPKTSFWIGGVDGGNWYNVKKYKKNIFFIEIYSDSDADLLNKGYYKIDLDIDSVEKLKYLINGYDGVNIILKNGTLLKKLK